MQIRPVNLYTPANRTNTVNFGKTYLLVDDAEAVHNFGEEYERTGIVPFNMWVVGYQGNNAKAILATGEEDMEKLRKDEKSIKYSSLLLEFFNLCKPAALKSVADMKEILQKSPNQDNEDFSAIGGRFSSRFSQSQFGDIN